LRSPRSTAGHERCPGLLGCVSTKGMGDGALHLWVLTGHQIAVYTCTEERLLSGGSQSRQRHHRHKLQGIIPMIPCIGLLLSGLTATVLSEDQVRNIGSKLQACAVYFSLSLSLFLTRDTARFNTRCPPHSFRPTVLRSNSRAWRVLANTALPPSGYGYTSLWKMERHGSMRSTNSVISNRYLLTGPKRKSAQAIS